MVQGVGYEFIQALHGHIYVFWLSKVFQLLNVSAPHLAAEKVQNQSRGAQVENLHVLYGFFRGWRGLSVDHVAYDEWDLGSSLSTIQELCYLQ